MREGVREGEKIVREGGKDGEEEGGKEGET